MNAGRILQFPLPAPAVEPTDPGPRIYTRADLEAARLQGGREAVPAVWGAIRADLAAVGISLPELRPDLEAVPDAPGERRELEAGA